MAAPGIDQKRTDGQVEKRDKNEQVYAGDRYGPNMTIQNERVKGGAEIKS